MRPAINTVEKENNGGQRVGCDVVVCGGVGRNKPARNLLLMFLHVIKYFYNILSGAGQKHFVNARQKKSIKHTHKHPYTHTHRERSIVAFAFS